jgi:hypothetical protein
MRPGAPIGHSGHGQTYQRIMGTVALSVWHCGQGLSLSGSNVISWTDKIGGISVPAPAVGNRPPLSADGTHFAGKSVLQMNSTGPKCLRGTGMATLLVSGTRPWVFVRARYRNVSPAANEQTTDFGVSAASDDMTFRLNSAGTQWEFFGTSGGNIDTGTYDTVAHSFSGWFDGAHKNYKIDGTTTQLSTAATLAHNTTAIGFGTAASFLLQSGSVSIPLVLIATAFFSRATDAQALAEAEFPA